MKSLRENVVSLIIGLMLVLAFLIAIRLFVETRYIPSQSMIPTLQINDRVILEKISCWTKQFNRGDIITFYPPPIEMGGHELSSDPLVLMGRLTGLPCFPNEVAFIKRVIGVPGDTIEIKSGVGVFVNGKLLEENYVSEKPEYDLKVLGDIKGRNTYGEDIQPFASPELCDKPIVIPDGQLFVMGDNRNCSEDSHVYGPVDQNRIVGKAFIKIWPKLEIMTPDQTR
ncbi:MAG: signal peptidase I [Candidatus Melainabacteria bacterium]|nr:signal peptidase I [Candidatus Melainabacteria bacterium]